MNLNEIIVFFICILVVLFVQISLLIIGNSNDCYFSDKTIKKLTIPEKSILRKLVIFKEVKMTNPPFLYIRVIPYLIQLFIVIVSTILFFIDQFAIDFIPSIVFMIIGYGTLGLYIIYELVLIFLSRGLRL
ncbi:unknown [Firmicutes bacterium CAG:631]|nr:unknown [Firmicutes bacterium CAG:631]